MRRFNVRKGAHMDEHINGKYIKYSAVQKQLAEAQAALVDHEILQHKYNALHAKYMALHAQYYVLRDIEYISKTGCLTKDE